MEVGEFAFPIDPVENLIRGMGQGAYRGAEEKSDIASLHSPSLSIFTSYSPFSQDCFR